MRFSLCYPIRMKPFTLTSKNVHEVLQNLKDKLEAQPRFQEFHFSEDMCRALGYSDELIAEIKSAGYLR